MEKIKKCFAGIVALSVFLSTLSIPATAAPVSLGTEGSTVVFSQDFNSSIIANPDDVYWKDESTINASLDSNTNNFFRIWRASVVPATGDNGPDGTKALYLNPRNGGSYYWLNNGVYEYYQWPAGRSADWTSIDIPYAKTTGSALTNGYYITTFDYYPSIGNEVFYLSGNTAFQDAWSPANSDIAFDARYNHLARAWYQVTITANLDDQIVWVSIKNADTGVEAYATHWSYTKGLGKLKILTDKGSNDAAEFSKPTNSAIIDNIKVVRKSFGGAISEPDYIFTQSFGSATIAAFFATSNPKWRQPGRELPDPPYMRVPLGVDMADPASRDETYSGYANKAYAYGGENGSRTLMLGTHGEAILAAQMSVGERRTNGTYKLTYKFYPANGTNKVVLDSLQTGTDNGRDGGVAFSVDNLSRKWYDAEVIVNLDANTATLTYYEDGTSTALYTDTKSYSMDLGVFEFVQDGTDGVVNTVEGSARFDDITLYNVYTAAPSFNSSLIQCFAGNEEQSDLSEIANTTDRIQIILPQQIKADTLLKANFTLLDSSDQEIATIGTYENGICTLAIDEPLEYGESYTLCIQNLENVSGYTMAAPYNEILTVAEKGSGINSVTKAGEDVVNAEAFTSGDTLRIDYCVKNPTNDTVPANLIIAYYGIDQRGIPQLVKFDVFHQEVLPSADPVDFSMDYIVPQIDSEFQQVRMMIWDSADSMQPYSNVISFGSRIKLSPIKNGVSIHTPLMRAYLNDAPENCGNYVDGLSTKDKPLPITFHWEWNSDETAPTEYILRVSENADMSRAKEFTVSETTYEVYNLKVGTRYYWNVTGTSGDNEYMSEISSFVTEDQAPRNLKVDGVRNIRDIGGWQIANGSRVKQGLVYRSFRMSEDKNDDFVYSISQEGIDTMRGDLGIQTEIDLRQNSEFRFNYSALGNDVNYIKAPMNYESDYMANNKAAIKTVFDALADPNMYPVVYHCAAGADRTAVITYLLNGLLGVEKADLLRDYSITNFSAQGSFRPVSGIEAKYVSTLDHYTGTTLAEKIYNYLNIEVGVSSDNLDFIIDYLSE